MTIICDSLKDGGNKICVVEFKTLGELHIPYINLLIYSHTGKDNICYQFRTVSNTLKLHRTYRKLKTKLPPSLNDELIQYSSGSNRSYVVVTEFSGCAIKSVNYFMERTVSEKGKLSKLLKELNY